MSDRPSLLGRALAAAIRAPLASALAAEQLEHGIKSPFSSWGEDSHLEHLTPDLWLGGWSQFAMNRDRAMGIATVAKARNVIAGQIGRLPLQAWKGRIPQTLGMDLLAQPERGVPRSTTITNTVDQLMFYPRAYWHVTERNSYGYPAYVKLVARDSIREDTSGNLSHVKGVAVRQGDVIRFDSPLGAGLLAVARETLQRAYVINQVTARAEDNPVPAIELHDTSTKDQLDEDDVRKLTDAWTANRRRSGVAYTPERIKVNTHGLQNDQLLIDARRSIQLELVRHLGVSAWVADVTVEGSTLKYENRALRNWELLDLNLAPYLTAIADRLSLADVTPRGWEVRFNTDMLTQPDEKTRAETAALWVSSKIKTPDEIRDGEGLAPMTIQTEEN
jgi:hypothetical protein